MKRLLPILFLLTFLSACRMDAATVISASITITNAPAVGATLTVNGDIRTWTNALGSTTILTNSTIAGSAADLLNEVAAYPFTNCTTAWLLNGIRLYATAGSNLTVTASAGWATVSYATNTSNDKTLLSVPFSLLSAAQKTNVFSELGEALNDPANTNRVIADATNVAYSVEAGHSTNADSATVAATATNLASGASLTNATLRGTVKRDHNYLYPVSNGTNYVVDFAQGSTFTIVATNDVAFLHATNFTAESSEAAVYIWASGGQRGIAYNSSWQLLQTNAPTTVASNKCAVVALGIKLPGDNNSQTNVVAACSSSQ